MNALSPYFLDDTRGVGNELDELDLKVNMRAGVYGTIRSVMSAGAMLTKRKTKGGGGGGGRQDYGTPRQDGFLVETCLPQ